jgi:hypothetical protein
MRCADFTGIWVIEPPREGTLHRVKKLISELPNTFSATAYREERGKRFERWAEITGTERAA